MYDTVFMLILPYLSNPIYCITIMASYGICLHIDMNVADSDHKVRDRISDRVMK